MPTIHRFRVLAVVALLLSASPAAMAQDLPADRKAALDRISADSLRGHLSFLASDLLEGRATPSRGQDLAAEYIASQFRRARGARSNRRRRIFPDRQLAGFRSSDASSFNLEFRIAGEMYRVAADAVTLSSVGKIDLRGVSLVKIANAAMLAEMRADQIEGRAVFIDMPDPRRVGRVRKGPPRRRL